MGSHPTRAGIPCHDDGCVRSEHLNNTSHYSNLRLSTHVTVQNHRKPYLRLQSLVLPLITWVVNGDHGPFQVFSSRLLFCENTGRNLAGMTTNGVEPRSVGGQYHTLGTGVSVNRGG
jgi:hypothetical protein